jgi:hypothetical protein
MKHKPIKIDWDALEEAFNNPQEELLFYLDRVTGHVVLEGEGEEDDLDQDDEDFEGGHPNPPPPVPVPLRSDSTRIYVDPPDSMQKVEWMKGFTADGRGQDPQVIARLATAVESDDPVNDLTEILNEHPEVRDAWYVYRAERVHEMIDDWLEENDVVPVDPPPWPK